MIASLQLEGGPVSGDEKIEPIFTVNTNLGSHIILGELYPHQASLHHTLCRPLANDQLPRQA